MLVYAIVNQMGETVAFEPTIAEAKETALLLEVDDIIEGTHSGFYLIEKKELEEL